MFRFVKKKMHKFWNVISLGEITQQRIESSRLIMLKFDMNDSSINS